MNEYPIDSRELNLGKLRPQVWLTWDSSHIDAVFGSRCLAPLFGTHAVLTDRIHLKLKNVVLLHH